VKYLAGAYRAANNDHSRAMHYYASGYYYAAKHQRLAHGRHGPPLMIAPQFEAPRPVEAAQNAADANANAQVPAR
jgi:hypothetical protein